MSRIISDILQSPEPHFSYALRSLEQRTGREGRDLRLISDVVIRRRKALSSLGLDENDTTAHELFYALRHKAAETNELFEAQLGVNQQMSPGELLNCIVSFIDELKLNRDVWVVKHAVVKSMLKKNPPKKLLKSLGLRSIDSVLKRSNSCELLSLALQVESAEWIKRIRRHYKTLHPSDFQSTKGNLYLLDNKKAEKLYQHGYSRSKLIIPNYETGIVLLFAAKHRFPNDTLVLTLAILQALYDIRIHSAYYRYISVHSDFGNEFLQTMNQGLPGGLYKNQIGWRVLQRHFNKQPEAFEEVEQPHFQHDDALLDHPIDVINQAIPQSFSWLEVPYVFMYVEGSPPVSLNLMDVLFNASNDIAYEDSRYTHLKSNLWEELSLRYLESQNVMDDTLNNLDYSRLTEIGSN